MRSTRVRIGTAGWSIPRGSAARFDADGTHLQRYARRLDCVEINSSFYRPHAEATYARWRDSTPPDFRFSVKMPRAITHDLRLQGARDLLIAFLAQTGGLAEKRGPILVQLPPSFAFEAALVTPFLDLLRDSYDGPVVWEPRHPTWFEPPVARLLERYGVARVAADPAAVPAAGTVGGSPRVAYFRLHGSPRMYWSRYDERYLAALAATVRGIAAVEGVWCVFDNTAGGFAIENAWELRQHLASDEPS